LENAFGDHAYTMEKLVAEVGAAFLCADLQITDEPRADHAQYLASWLSVMKEEKKAIFTAASKASEAAAYLTGLQS
jgi:antirestriction protein ArdC